MRIRIKRACFAGDGRVAVPGEVIELDEQTARFLIAIRKAEPAPPAPKRRERKAEED